MKLIKSFFQLFIIVVTLIAVQSCDNAEPRIVRSVSEMTQSDSFLNSEQGVDVVEPQKIFRRDEIDNMFKFAHNAGQNVFKTYVNKGNGIIAEVEVNRFERASDGTFVIICYDAESGQFERNEVDMPGFFAYRYDPEKNNWKVYIKKSGSFSRVDKPFTLKSGAGFDVKVTPTVTPEYIGDGYHDTVKKSWLVVTSHVLDAMTVSEKNNALFGQ